MYSHTLWLQKFSLMKCELNIQHVASVGQGKNLSPRRELNPWPPRHWAAALFTELRELMVSKSVLKGSSVNLSKKNLKRK